MLTKISKLFTKFIKYLQIVHGLLTTATVICGILYIEEERGAKPELFRFQTDSLYPLYNPVLKPDEWYTESIIYSQ